MRLAQILQDKRGGVAILIGLCTVVLFGFVALVIDIGHGLVARNELHNVADAAALAATRELGRIYMAMPEASQPTYVMSGTDGSDVKTQAINVAAMNFAAGLNVAVDVNDIEIGQWDPATKTLTVTDAQPDAVRVTTRRDGTINGPISTFFARIIGHNTMNVRATATAALTGLGQIAEGKADIPIGIDADRYVCPPDEPDCHCGTEITFHPTGTYEGCGAWMSYDISPSNANTLKDNIIPGLGDGSYVPPAIGVGETVNFTGGTVTSALDAFKDLFDQKKLEEEPYTEWEATVVIYESNGCNNPSGPMVIVGFGQVTITDVVVPPEGAHNVKGKIACDEIQEGRGGGGYYGVTGTIPTLVQ